MENNEIKKWMISSNQKVFNFKVIPGSAKTQFKTLMEDGTIKIAVKATPQKGKANKEILSFLEKYLELPKGSIKILTGKTSKVKRIQLF